MKWTTWKLPRLRFWAPGDYSNDCVSCGGTFVGDKRANHCARCAYSDGNLADTADFHEAFEIPVLAAPGIPPKDRRKLRIKLLREEVRELEEAMEAGDIKAVLQEITDIQYVLNGTYLELGLHTLKARALDEVHRANMTKLVGGKPLKRPDGKVLKGPNYSPPDLSFVEQRGAAE